MHVFSYILWKGEEVAVELLLIFFQHVEYWQWQFKEEELVESLIVSDVFKCLNVLVYSFIVELFYIVFFFQVQWVYK